MDGKLNFQSGNTPDRVDSGNVQKKSTRAGVLAMIRGTANQIIVQLRLASEFGLPHSDIFSEDFRGLNRGEIESLIIDWLRNGDEGLENINQLHSDLLAHQIAVISGLDGIVQETLKSLAPEENRTKAGQLSTKKKDLKVYAEVFQDLNENIVKRHQRIVVPGFVSAYIKARDKQIREPVTIEEFDK